MSRDQIILSFRPEINFDSNAPSKEMEQFQNKTLRPILKFQHELTQQLLYSDSNFKKILKPDLDSIKFSSLLIRFLKSDHLFKAKLLGTIIGMMSSDELNFYKENKREVEKRIIVMQEKRYLDSID